MSKKEFENKIIKRFYGMVARCHNPDNKNFKNYGDRGITVCLEWRLESGKFVEWSLKNGFSPELTIERLDNDKGYSPENCAWITQKAQAQNRRGVKLAKEDAKEIRRLFQSTRGMPREDRYTYRKLMVLFDISRTHVKRVLKGTRWKDV